MRNIEITVQQFTHQIRIGVARIKPFNTVVQPIAHRGQPRDLALKGRHP